MIFEKIGVAQVNKDLQCLVIQVDSKLYLIGLQDLDAVKDNRIIGVFQIKEPLVQTETAESEKVV